MSNNTVQPSSPQESKATQTGVDFLKTAEETMQDVNLIRHFKTAAIILTILVIIMGIVSIMGWFLNISAFYQINASWPEFKINAAFGMIFAAISLLISILNSDNRIWSILAKVAAIFAIIIGSATLVEYFFQKDLGIDQALVTDLPEGNAGFEPGRMGAAASICCIIAGISVLIFSLKKKFPVMQVLLSSIILIVTFVSALALFTGGKFRVLETHPMSLIGSLGFFMLSVSVFLSSPSKNQFMVLVNNRASGFVARLILPSCFIVPTVIGELVMLGSRLGFYSTELMLPIVITLSITIAFVLSLVISHIIYLIDLREAKTSSSLKATNKELEAFSYSVSHDLNTPLRSIATFTQYLSDEYKDKVDEKANDYINRILNATKRMGALIEGILNLSRINRSEMKVELVNLSEVAKEVTSELQQNNPERKVDVDIMPSVYAETDRTLITIVLGNLINNAWKFTKNTANAKIEFGMIQKNNKIVYFVRDNGAGFDPQFINKLFVPFQRLHTSQEFEGTGIGLATAQRVINKNNGEIWAESSPNKGASFYFTLHING